MSWGALSALGFTRSVPRFSCCQVGPAGHTTMPPDPPCGILPRPSGVFLHHLLGCISAVRKVSLIQGLIVLPQDYKYRP
jgi:hypothetical protein